jgi:F-type H+-transporting ATPase subunit delta
MSAFTHPYSRAFLESAPAGYDVEKFLAGAQTLTNAIAENPSLRAFLATPAVSHEAKRKALTALAALAGLDVFGARFFDVLLKNHRILEAGEILKSLAVANDAAHGIVRGSVTVPNPIGDPEKAKIEEAVGRRVGGTVRLAVEVDPSILAGFVARVSSNVFDASAVAAIRRFQEQAKEKAGA